MYKNFVKIYVGEVFCMLIKGRSLCTIIVAPQDFGLKIKEHLSECETNGFLEDSILRRNDEAIRYKPKLLNSTVYI